MLCMLPSEQLWRNSIVVFDRTKHDLHTLLSDVPVKSQTKIAVERSKTGVDVADSQASLAMAHFNSTQSSIVIRVTNECDDCKRFVISL